MDEFDEFVVGETVYSKHTGKAHVIRRISPSGSLAFGSPPYNSGSYVTPWGYTRDEAKAVADALAYNELNVAHYEGAVEQANRRLSECRFNIQRLNDRLREIAPSGD
jgi:hypothetical protein